MSASMSANMRRRTFPLPWSPTCLTCAFAAAATLAVASEELLSNTYTLAIGREARKSPMTLAIVISSSWHGISTTTRGGSADVMGSAIPRSKLVYVSGMVRFRPALQRAQFRRGVPREQVGAYWSARCIQGQVLTSEHLTNVVRPGIREQGVDGAVGSRNPARRFAIHAVGRIGRSKHIAADSHE